ncbi:MAG: sugar phosphate isomerase/epimerase family protein, partial [Vicinamibacterales bacterium]
MVRKRLFGVSTHLYHGQRLSRDHIVEVGAHGFEAVELFATQTHFDYHNPGAIADLQGWLAEGRAVLHSVHAPVGESFAHGRWGPLFSLASPDPAARQRALDETERALHIARRIPFQVLVLHLGVPKTPQSPPGENSRDAARRSLDVLARLAEPLGVTLAVEVIPNELSRPASLAHMVESLEDEGRLGVCLDFGHAHLCGGVIDAVETLAEHVCATHVHDNRGRTDEHLVPFDGTIDWPSALTGVQKIGYEGVLLFEVGPQGSTRGTLQRLREVRNRMERLLADAEWCIACMCTS